MYYIIKKFEVINGVVKSTSIGYTSEVNEVISLNSQQNGFNSFFSCCNNRSENIICSGCNLITTNGTFNGSDVTTNHAPMNLEDLGVNIWL